MEILALTPAQSTAFATWVAAVAALATLLVLVWTASYAKRQLDHAKDLRRDQTRPYVVPSIGIEQQMLFMFYLENLGSTPAFDVRLTFDPAPESEMKDLEKVAILRDPIPTLPPRQKLRTYWESALTVFDENAPYPHPKRYKVGVSYRDHQGHNFGPEPFVLDFNVYEGQASGLKAFPDLVKAIEDLTKEHKKWSYPMGGVWVNVVDAVRKARREDRPSHYRRMKQRYAEEGSLGAFRYWIDVWRKRYGLWSR